VYAPILPPVDAEFAKMLGVENGDVAALRKEVKENLEREVKKRSQAKVKDQAMNALLEAAQFDLPRSLVGMEIERLMEQTFETFKARGVDVAQGSFLKPELFEEQAKRRVKLGLILAELVNQHELHAKPEQVRAMVEEQSKSFEKPEDVVKWAGAPLAIVDCFGILSDEKIRRYFELGCEVKALGRGHIQRIKEEVRAKRK
jgi:trigger factor